MIGLITVNYNDSDTVKVFIEKVVLLEEINYIIVVDNASTDGSFGILSSFAEKYNKVDVIQSGKNGGYGYGNNCGVRYAVKKYHCDAVLVSNPDVVFDGTAVRRMKAALDADRKTAAAAPLMKDGRGKNCTQTAWKVPKSGWGFVFMDLPFIRYLLKHRYYYSRQKLTEREPVRTEALAGSLLMLRTEDFVKAGGYDESLFLYCEETVLAIRLERICKRSLLLTDISYIHNHSTTICRSYRSLRERVRLLFESKATVLKKYYGYSGLRLRVFYKVRWLCLRYAGCRDFISRLARCRDFISVLAGRKGK